MASIRDLLPDYCTREEHPSLREAAEQPLQLLFNRSPEEDVVHALVPGDKLEDHPKMKGVAIDPETQTIKMTEGQILGVAAREDLRGRPAPPVDPRIVSPGVYRRNKQVTIRSGGGNVRSGG